MKERDNGEEGKRMAYVIIIDIGIRINALTIALLGSI